MDRILQNVPATLQTTLFSGTTPSDPLPDTATIQVKRADGSDLLAALSTTNATGTGVFERALTPTQTSILDILTCRWTMTVGTSMSLVTHAEIVGGFLCSLAELKGSFPNSTDPELAAIRTAAEQRLEQACKQAFVPRLTVETRMMRTRLRLAWPNVRAIRFASVGGVALTSGQLSSLVVSPSGLVTGFPGPSSVGFYQLVIGYEHGKDYPTDDIREAVTLAAEETFSTSDARIIRREADDQSLTYASPSTTSFSNPVLRTIVRNNTVILVA